MKKTEIPRIEPPSMPAPAKPDPTSAEAIRKEGDAFYLKGRFAEAASRYEAALKVNPADADAHNNLGAALADLGKPGDSVARYREALRLRPEFPDASYNLGNALRSLNRFAEAVASYAQALRIRPDFSEGHNNLGIALRRLNRLSEAAISFREALRLRPRFPLALSNLGLVLADMGRIAEAIACYDEAIKIEPESADAHRNKSLAVLLLGDLPRGLAEYEWRWKCSDFRPIPFTRPAWFGEPIAGKAILLYTEQGLGDALMFARFARPVKALGATVVLSAPESLHPILSTCPGIDRLVPRRVESQDFDLRAPLLSVPHLLGTTIDTIPAEIPYLSADPVRIEAWKRELSSIDGLRVGISWQGNPDTHYDLTRSIPLNQFSTLARVENVRLIGLQKGRGTEQIAGRFDLIDLGPRLDVSGGAFIDTAAVLKDIDLLITCDSALAHLSGALGVPTWVVLPAVPDWRWFLDRESSPWYPSVRLFRQEMAGDWSRPFKRMAEALVGLVAR